MIIENHTGKLIYVVSFFGNSRSVSFSMIPARTIEKAPKVTSRSRDPYVLAGTLQVRDPGFVITGSDFTSAVLVFDGRVGKFERRSTASLLAHIRCIKEGVLVCTDLYMNKIGI